MRRALSQRCSWWATLLAVLLFSAGAANGTLLCFALLCFALLCFALLCSVLGTGFKGWRVFVCETSMVAHVREGARRSWCAINCNTARERTGGL